MKTRIRIVIPTYNRSSIKEQVTLNSLPKELMKDVWLVIQEQQMKVYKPIADHFGCQIHTLPTGSKGICLAVKQIAYWLEGQRYLLLHDDLKFSHFDWPGKGLGDNGKNYSRDNTPSIETWRFHIGEMNTFMDNGIVHGGLGATNAPPSQDRKQYDMCTRVWTNAFYSEKLPVKEIDWGTDYEFIPEDFLVILHLFEMGYPNVVFQDLKVSPSATQTKGGCDEYRSLELHNQGQLALVNRFPKSCKTVGKVFNSGPFEGKEKLMLRIQWKQQYKKVHGTIPKWRDYYG